MLHAEFFSKNSLHFSKFADIKMNTLSGWHSNALLLYSLFTSSKTITYCTLW